MDDIKQLKWPTEGGGSFPLEQQGEEKKARQCGKEVICLPGQGKQHLQAAQFQ